jgi:nitrogen fixation protein NifX
MAQSIGREAALRVALAARELGILSARELVSALVERLELPLTEAKLATVTVADLQLMLQGDEVIETDVAREQLKQAVRLLWGEDIVNSDLPPVARYAAGDMPGSIRVACASNRGSCSTGTLARASAFWSTRSPRTRCG